MEEQDVGLLLAPPIILLGEQLLSLTLTLTLLNRLAAEELTLPRFPCLRDVNKYFMLLEESELYVLSTLF